MRVLHIINSLGTGGAEKLILDTIPLYRGKGIEVDVLLLWDNNHVFTKKLKDSGVCKVFILQESDRVKDIYSLSHIVKIRQIIKGYDVLHVHLFPAQYFVALANIGIGKKLIFTEHSTQNKRMTSSIFSKIDRFIYKFYKTVVSISSDVSTVLKSHIPSSVSVIQIENGVNVQTIQDANKYRKEELALNLKNKDVVICQVSAFRKGKDQETLVRSLTYLPEYYKLLLVGEGDKVEKEKVEHLVETLHLEERVTLLGVRNDVHRIVTSVDINVLSSSFEGLSLASVEGLASGKPFVASDVPGLRDVVGGAGVLFPLGDAGALAKEIQLLIEDKEYNQRVVASCLKRSRQYDINVMVDKHIALYKEVYES